MAPVPETDPPIPPSSEEFTEKFKKILKSNGINDVVSEVTLKDSGLVGEGFASQSNYVTVQFENSSLKPLNLFVKTVTSNASHTEFLEGTKLFEKEATFFTKYVPAAKEFCRSKGMEKLLDIYPKCYYGDTKMIVLENLVLDKGFELLDKTEQQDLEASSLALKTLAKHHAMSHALLQELGQESFFKKFPNLDFEPFAHEVVRTSMGPSIENGIQTNIQLLERCDIKGKEVAIAMLKEKEGKSWEYLMNSMKLDPKDKLRLLNHGDYWNNNMMFLRNKETRELVGHVAIDLQAVRYDAPGADLGYFLFSSVKPEVRRKHLKELLTIYMDELNGISDKLGCPTNLTYNDLYESFCRKLDFGFWFFGILIATRASYAVLKDFNITTVDMNEWGTIYSGMIKKWIEENPKLSEEDAEGIVKLMFEYKSLKNH